MEGQVSEGLPINRKSKITKPQILPVSPMRHPAAKKPVRQWGLVKTRL
jgi:hypothetical protein